MRSILRSLVAVVFLFGATYGVVAAKPDTPAAGGETINIEDCKTCHEASVGNAFLRSYHAGVEQSCASCHKGSAAHGKAQMEGDTSVPTPASPKNMKASEVTELCLSCHEKTHHPNWSGSMHDRRGMACTECHSVHSFASLKAQLKTTSSSDTCFRCHKDKQAQAMRTSHHPVREGLLECVSCHNPHDGTRPKMIKADYTNELCYQCHAEKRGPFLWEHAPVRENCLNCHNPHGSNHDKMLVARLPWLCQRCHLNTRHPGTIYSGVNAATETVATATNRAVEHACKNCHQNIHGGNAPSAPYLAR